VIGLKLSAPVRVFACAPRAILLTAAGAGLVVLLIGQMGES